MCRVVLAERGPSRSVHLQRQLLSYHARTAALRSGGRQKLLPRATLLRKLHLRHLQRLAASAFGCGSRCAELLPLVELQLRLSTHRYAKVRRAAQDGVNVSLRLHPWLGRQHLPRLIGVLSDPAAAAHECKGAAFLLHASSVMRKVRVGVRVRVRTNPNHYPNPNPNPNPNRDPDPNPNPNPNPNPGGDAHSDPRV